MQLSASNCIIPMDGNLYPVMHFARIGKNTKFALEIPTPPKGTYL